ncbi:MAG: aminotransferase class V-fold PLP-dependent enzyme, partial [Acidimicrobiia bacterium]
LGIDLETSSQFEQVIATGCEVIKPGWVRVNFNYFIPEEEFSYLLEAVHLVADQGWRLLPLYTYEAETALWRHRAGLPKPPTSLNDLDYGGGEMGFPQTAGMEELGGYLAEAKRILAEQPETDGNSPDLGPDAERLRWFPNPAEITI